ncbi:small-subunit processome [Rhypophila decipiens]|uniref:U3 small nucleolar RNA-associated protein 11 n=1 Tax=Rhypophila decipiens TaxID=261697 RepID=A0AAN6YDF3_9PEZI|nr:small-subunit processome [Rhypophila decipiens]
MSSLRNSVQRRSHRERAQPLERQRLGLLEKKKDYQKRAKDYNKKKTILKSLREKAADRNEDEFYFGMLSRNGPGSRLAKGKSFTGTVENGRGNKAMDMDTVRLLKTQDLGYLRTMRNVAAKEVQDLEERYIIATGLNADDLSDEDEDDDDWSDDDDEAAPSAKKSKPTGPKKIVFCDDVDEREQMAAAEKQKAQRRISRVDSDDEMMDDVDDEESQKRQKEAARKAQNVRRLQNKLKNAKKKLKALSDAERELEIQQAKMAKTATSGGITKTGRRIKVKERKR